MDKNQFNLRLEKGHQRLNKIAREIIDLDKVPLVYKNEFLNSLAYFSDVNIPQEKMGYVEEIGDVIYQSFKIIAVKNKVLTPQSQRKLYDFYGDRIIESTSAAIFNTTFNEVYNDALKLIKSDDVDKLDNLICINEFPNSKKFAEKFLVNQYISYITRKMTAPYVTKTNNSTGFHSEKLLKNTKFAEEIAELVEVLTLPNKKLKGFDLINDMSHTSSLVTNVLYYASNIIENNENEISLFPLLNQILQERVSYDINIEKAFDFNFKKINGRQELTFNGYLPDEIKKIVKPLEYVMEVKLVTQNLM